MRVVSLESPLKGHQPCKKASNPPACSDHGLHVLKPRSFSPNCAPKWGKDINCSLGCGLHPSFRNRGALWRIFSSNESAPAIRKTGFYADRDPNKQEAGVIFA
jgi:hypothetical protein